MGLGVKGYRRHPSVNRVGMGFGVCRVSKNRVPFLRGPTGRIIHMLRVEWGGEPIMGDAHIFSIFGPPRKQDAGYPKREAQRP